MRWYITKKALVLLIGLLVAAIFVMALTSCIPVTIRPERDSKGLPKAIPVTLVGAQDLKTGAFIPAYPVSDVVRSSRTQTVEVKIKDATGAWLAVEVQTMPLIDQGGRVHGYAEILRDLSGKKSKCDRAI